ncbi:class I SAM-dependent methyltransferase [Rothia nasimurium]|uniref:Methyltransferase n=1 Tax=Luteibacter anthropi TaxID=564369 RepID=A0A7X5UDF4_9GAMM|nr:class I SAM-dependent methyltransferase [Luteibacter anthropi]NII08444.1 methyltransferase [Luteibacter anthropi]
MTTKTKPSPLDPLAQATIDDLHAMAKRQLRSMLGHYLPRLPAMLLGRPVRPPKDMSFFDDKMLPIDQAQGELLYLLARSRNARHIVEFGTSFGVSTIYLAAAVRDNASGGKVIGTELVPAKVTRARAHLQRAGLAEYVDIKSGDARETLREVADGIDFLLLDGWPRLAADILHIVEPRLAKGAVVVLDNVGQFRAELGSAIDRLTRAPFRSATLPFKGGTLVSLFEGA